MYFCDTRPSSETERNEINKNLRNTPSPLINNKQKTSVFLQNTSKQKISPQQLKKTAKAVKIDCLCTYFFRN